MSRYIEFELDDGSKIFFESDEGESGVVKLGIGDITDRVSKTFEQAVENSHKASLAILSKLRDLSPDEIEITFGLKASGEIQGLVVAKASGEANFNIKMIWKK